MKLLDRQTIFDLTLTVYGDMSGLVNLVADNDDLFASDANFTVTGDVVNQTVVDYFSSRKPILTY